MEQDDIRKIRWPQLLGKNYSRLTFSPTGTSVQMSIKIERTLYDVWFTPRGDAIACECKCLDPNEVPADPEDARATLSTAMRLLPKTSPVKVTEASDGSFVMTTELSASNNVQAQAAFSEYLDSLREFHKEVRKPALLNPPGLMFVYTGRFQPYHRGHHDVVSRLITRDPTLPERYPNTN